MSDYDELKPFAWKWNTPEHNGTWRTHLDLSQPVTRDYHMLEPLYLKSQVDAALAGLQATIQRLEAGLIPVKSITGNNKGE